MNFTVVIQPRAMLQVIKAALWYDKLNIGLGQSFSNGIEKAYEEIGKNPTFYKLINKRYRRYRVTRFPYIIVYKITGNTVMVIAVRHYKKLR